MELNGYQIWVQRLILSTKLILPLKKYENLYVYYTFKFLHTPLKLVLGVWRSLYVLKIYNLSNLFEWHRKFIDNFPTESKYGIHFSPSPTVFLYSLSFYKDIGNLCHLKKNVGVGEKQMPDFDSVGKNKVKNSMTFKKI